MRLFQDFRTAVNFQNFQNGGFLVADFPFRPVLSGTDGRQQRHVGHLVLGAASFDGRLQMGSALSGRRVAAQAVKRTGVHRKGG